MRTHSGHRWNKMNNLNFLRENPPLNWLDYFVDRRKFCKLLETEGPDSKQISTLAYQFTEQAVLVDKECEALSRKEFDEEDLAYSRRKAANLWICALSCFASINWNLDLMKQCSNIMLMKALMNRLVAFCYQTNVGSNDDIFSHMVETPVEAYTEKPEQLFACWIYATWLLKVDVDGRFPEIVAKPTVSNPLNQFDANLMQAEQLKNCIAELRRNTSEAEKLIKKILKFVHDIKMMIPSKDCFLGVLLKEPNLAIDTILNSGSLSDASVPFPIFHGPNVHLEYKYWSLKAHYSLLCNHFAAGKIQEARNDLNQILRNWSAYKKGLSNEVESIVSIDDDILAGYCDAFGISYNFSPSKSYVQNEKLMYGEVTEKSMEVLECCSMVSRSECQRIASTSAAAIANDILAKNIISEYCKGFLATSNTLNKLLTDSSAITHLIEICSNLLKKKTNERIVEGILLFFTTKIPNFLEEFKKINPNCSRDYLMNFRDIPLRKVCSLPSMACIKELLSGGTDAWRLIVTFDMNEIRALYASFGGKFNIPRRSRVSKIVGDVISAAASQGNFDHISLILGKLEQLAMIGDGTQWRTFCNECVKELGPLGKVQEVQVRFAFDAVRVQLECWHARFSRVSNNPQFVHVTQSLNSTVKGLIQSSMTSQVSMSKMMLHTVTFFINTSEWEFLLRSFSKMKSPFLDVAKMIAAYMTTSDPAVSRQIAEGPWWHVMHSTFLDYSSANKRRNDGSLVREQTKQLLTRMQFLEMLRLIKEYRTISFLISFLGKMFNASQNVFRNKKESDGLLIGQDINKDIFIEHPDYWQSYFEKKSDDELVFNLPFLKECLETIYRNALIVNPINAFWLRSFADFCFAVEKFDGALVLYMEACVACSDSLLRPLPDNVVDDIMWLKIQRCLHSAGAETLSALVCQLMRNPVERYVPTATSLMETQGDTLDACTAYFPLISDINLAEFMSDVFQKLYLQKKEQLLMKTAMLILYRLVVGFLVMESLFGRDFRSMKATVQLVFKSNYNLTKLRAISVPEINSHNVSQLERFRRRERLLFILCAYIFRIHF